MKNLLIALTFMATGYGINSLHKCKCTAEFTFYLRGKRVAKHPIKVESYLAHPFPVNGKEVGSRKRYRYDSVTVRLNP